MHNNLVKFFAAAFLLVLLVVPALAFAQTQISVAIPGSNANTSSSSPGAFVANFYQFALLIGGILAFGAIVFGGVKYAISAGNPSGQSDAKEWIWGALTGLLLLAGAYLILYTINPQLLNLNLATLNGITVATSNYMPTNSTTPPASTTATCAGPASGPCAAANLSNTCFSGNPTLWAGICANESRGEQTTKSGTDYCLGPNGQGKYSVSVGLFQVNITNSWKQTVDGQNCSNAFVNGTTGAGQAVHCSGKGPCTGSGGASCQISNVTLYNDCVAAAQVAASNITVACQLSNNGSNTGPWKADAKKCGF